MSDRSTLESNIVWAESMADDLRLQASEYDEQVSELKLELENHDEAEREALYNEELDDE